MTRPRLLPLLAVSGALIGGLAGGPAWAADVTPAQATALEVRLHDWMASLAGPAINVGVRPVLVTADGDHFVVELPAPDLLAATGIVPAGLSVKLKAKPLDGGRYALDDLMLPTPLKLTPPPVAGEPAMTADVSLASQEYHAIFDPSYATTSSFDTKWTGFHIKTGTSDTITARSVGHSTWQPVGDGRINVLSEGNSEESKSTFTTKEGKSISYTIAKSRSSSRVNSVSPDSMAAFVRSITALVPTLPDIKDNPNQAQRALARTAVFALRDMLGGFEGSQSFEQIKLVADGHQFSLARAGLGSKAGVTDGKLGLETLISFEGVDSPEVPAGVFREYLPRKVTLKPRMSGIPTEDLFKLALRAIDSDAKDMDQLQESAMALLAAGPLEFGVDDLLIDLGPAKLMASGSLDVAGLSDITGEAEITVEGLDSLIKRANVTPEIKQIAPALIFLKGIGKQDGTKTVWNVVYEDNKVTVNDTDLTDLIPSDKPPVATPAPAPAPKKK